MLVLADFLYLASQPKVCESPMPPLPPSFPLVLLYRESLYKHFAYFKSAQPIYHQTWQFMETWKIWKLLLYINTVSETWVMGVYLQQIICLQYLDILINLWWTDFQHFNSKYSSSCNLFAAFWWAIIIVLTV